MVARTLMIQGTSSSAGKSVLVAALCRILARHGLRVAPFKAQNMSNNAAVCSDGSEIGRSQALQALAAGIESSRDMNPVLLKPEADTRSQVIVNGHVWKTLGAKDYFRRKAQLWPVVTAALDRLRKQYEFVVIEGAGSPAELNLADVEIVNMAVARYCQSPVLLVGDIERGGVFAQLLGTLWLLPPEDRRLVCGLLVNKFRGDVSLFDCGRSILEQRGEVPVLGVIPWVKNLDLPEEDSETLSRARIALLPDSSIDIAVVRLPHLANFDDFAPLAAEPHVSVRYVNSCDELGAPSVIILPGTKSTLGDLRWLRQMNLDKAIVDLHGLGTHVVGICGGYQMLGQKILDPEHVESNQPSAAGLALLPVTTVFAGAKETHQTRATIVDDRPCPGMQGDVLEGYEIHLGQTTGGVPWLQLARRDGSEALSDGATSTDGRVWGCYLHGLFANDSFRRCWLKSLRSDQPSRAPVIDYAARIQASLDRLADTVEAALDWRKLEKILAGQWETSDVG